jgi:NADP-dependent aldehyde dehydrogenase
MPDTTLSGSNFIDGNASSDGKVRLTGLAATSGELLAPAFAIATEHEIAEAGRAAQRAFEPYSSLPAEKRAAFLDSIADHIEAIGDSLLERAHLESALPLARLTGERGRTCGQLRFFAQVVREGSWVDARIDLALPDRKPLPRPDIRRMLVALGPVAVFGASNFPLAFSVAGGDTASALAAGCPVIVKSHPGHLGTSELVAQAIIAAAKACDIPSGVFSLLHGEVEVGRAIVQLPEIKAVGFTGSLAAGRSLYDLAARRPCPIPVYAEMGSVNPVFVLPGALALRSAAVAKGFAESLTLGVGQFCTNPGLIIGIAGSEFDHLLGEIKATLASVSPGTMLTSGISERYLRGVEDRVANTSLTNDFVGGNSPGKVTPSLFSVTGEEFLVDTELAEELFGPSAIAVRCQDEAELLCVASRMVGQLTATVHFELPDESLATKLIPLLSQVAGRVLANSYPTGVEVTHAMQHGGPFPATTDSRSTSVGSAAILRFARPVAFQDLPDFLLPIELRSDNPRGIWRTVNGELKRS